MSTNIVKKSYSKLNYSNGTKHVLHTEAQNIWYKWLNDFKKLLVFIPPDHNSGTLKLHKVCKWIKANKWCNTNVKLLSKIAAISRKKKRKHCQKSHFWNINVYVHVEVCAISLNLFKFEYLNLTLDVIF